MPSTLAHPSGVHERIPSKHFLCHDTDEIPHTFLSSVWLNFHREPWVVTPKIELNTKQTVVKTEHFTAVFLYPFLGRT